MKTPLALAPSSRQAESFFVLVMVYDGITPFLGKLETWPNSGQSCPMTKDILPLQRVFTLIYYLSQKVPQRLPFPQSKHMHWLLF